MPFLQPTRTAHDALVCYVLRERLAVPTSATEGPKLTHAHGRLNPGAGLKTKGKKFGAKGAGRVYSVHIQVKCDDTEGTIVYEY